MMSSEMEVCTINLVMTLALWCIPCVCFQPEGFFYGRGGVWVRRKASYGLSRSVVRHKQRIGMGILPAPPFLKGE